MSSCGIAKAVECRYCQLDLRAFATMSSCGIAKAALTLLAL